MKEREKERRARPCRVMLRHGKLSSTEIIRFAFKRQFGLLCAERTVGGKSANRKRNFRSWQLSNGVALNRIGMAVVKKGRQISERYRK